MTKTIFDELEVISTELNLVSDDLSNSIAHIEEKLKHLAIGIQCFITISDNVEFGYSRFDKRWCLVVKKDDEQWSLLQAPRYLRILSVKHIPNLLEAMVEASKAAIIRIEKSANTAKEMLETFEHDQKET